jgi:hypothetical protein
MDPRFVPEEEVIFIPEPDVQVPGGAQFLRIVEFQDWNPPPTSDDEDYRRDDMDDDGSVR